MPSPDVILFYDGTCGFCSRSVQFILRHEGSNHSLHFAALQGPTAAALRQRHPELASLDSMVWYEPASSNHRELLFVRSAAGIAAMAYLGRAWCLLALIVWAVPRPIRDAVYDAVARNRHRLSPGNCLVPSPQHRSRFID
ncbi:MAG: DCC1-like thiol-disulfide oxidoreductase family protein [Tepidisphaeraceae bacterium]|jgi:predicted DCC family thiol-disulfide oxidoreductase YuxK